MADAARLLRVDAHDDGINRWEMQRFTPSGALTDLVGGYTDYAERTAGFTTRRELPHGEGVLIINLGEPIEITAGNGELIQLGTGRAFVAGFHLRPALSWSASARAARRRPGHHRPGSAQRRCSRAWSAWSLTVPATISTPQIGRAMWFLLSTGTDSKSGPCAVLM